MKRTDPFSKDFLLRCRRVTKIFSRRLTTVWEPKDQILKMYEEVTEVQLAKDKKELINETCDVILASIALLDILEVPYKDIQEHMNKTLEKVEDRADKLQVLF